MVSHYHLKKDPGMRKPRVRRSNRKKRVHKRHVYIDSANIIQKRCREYLDNRYINVCANFDDDEFIMLTPVKYIPKSLLIVLDKQAFHVGYLLKWILKSNPPIHPLTRLPLPMKIQEDCVSKLLEYLSSDDVNFRNYKKNFFTRKNKFKRLLVQWQKSQCDKN